MGSQMLAINKYLELLNKDHRVLNNSLHSEFENNEEVMLGSYGHHQFKGDVAAPYLERQGLPRNLLETTSWTKDLTVADGVAAAVLEWAKDNGASVYCHWFQPLGANGVRHGQSAMVQHRMFEFDRNGAPVWDFRGKHLLHSETDGSSFPNGGLRATHRAGGYLCLDPSSPILLRGDTIYIPACFFSYTGYALDERTPLLRSCESMSKQGTRLLRLLGYDTPTLVSNIGLEQEFFLVPREAFLRRPDLQFTGRTLVGYEPARGQEMSDHYMGSLSYSQPALQCIKEVQEKCFAMGIPLKTRHREVAPNQYEFAPLFGTVTTQVDQNLMVMQMLEETAASYGLTALLHEKPFDKVNGSGKHNNWSIGTPGGVNLLNCGQITAETKNPMVFPIIIAAIMKGFHKYADLLRMAIATPGNDFRLGGMEAPPSIMSMYLGEDLTNYLEALKNGSDANYTPTAKPVDLGVSGIPAISVPAEDRNRTSPFPYGGHRFEFRAVGSSQNVSLVNTVLNTLCASSFKEFADAIEAGSSPIAVARAALQESWAVISNGNGYDLQNQKEMIERGLYSLTNIESMARYTVEKNVEVFERTGVLTREECTARQNVLYNHYIGTVEMEAKTLIDMIVQQIIPAVSQHVDVSALRVSVDKLRGAVTAVHHIENLHDRADAWRNIRLGEMLAVRKECDAVEGLSPATAWPIATYKQLLFLDTSA